MSTITKLAASSVAGAALTTLLVAAPASASTNGCLTAPFRCGDMRAVQGPSLIGAVAWVVAGKGHAGDPVVSGQNTATSARTDFEVNHFAKGGLTAEYAPNGHRSGLYVGVGAISYTVDGFTVKPGTLILMGWNGAWAEKWQQGAGGRISNDLTGLQVGVAEHGKPLPTVTTGAVWQEQGN